MSCEIKKWVYVLIDPRDGLEKSVGLSKDLDKRLKDHIYKSKIEKTQKAAWVRELLSLDLKPELLIVKECTKDNQEYWEHYYIQYYKSAGRELLNYDDYGVGIIKGLKKETRALIVEAISTPITMYNLQGEKLRVFASLRDAERRTGINHGNISRSCSKSCKHASGFIFRYGDEKCDIIVRYPNAAKKVVQEIDENGVVVNEFKSIAVASIEVGIDASNICRVCNGKKKSSKGRIFRFKNESDIF